MILYIAQGERGGVPVLDPAPPATDVRFWGWLRDQITRDKGAPPTDSKPSRSRVGGVTEAPTKSGKPPPVSPGSYCFGADVAICADVPTQLQPACYALSNIICLVVGVFVLLALIGIAVNALIRS